MSPILSFTAEECWGHLSKDGKSVFLQDLPEASDSLLNAERDARWSAFLDIRGEILKNLEVARKDKKIIGHSLDALVEVYASGKTLELLK